MKDDYRALRSYCWQDSRAIASNRLRNTLLGVGNAILWLALALFFGFAVWGFMP